MTRKYFVGINNLEDLKTTYKKLAMQHHPDRGGDPEAMKAINAEYSILSKTLKSSKKKETAAEEAADTKSAEDFAEILQKIIHIEGIEIEICGSWLWVSGDTRPAKAELKAAGFFWASKKGMWYWRAEDYKHHGKSGATIDDIRSKYGSEKISGDYRPTLS